MGSGLLIGVNLAGAEFGEKNIPGTYNKDYTYPTDAEIDYYASKGMEVIRLPFLWERLQPIKDGQLDSTQLALLDHVVSYATSKGLKVILDPHDYGSYFGHPIGSGKDPTPNAAFANFWGQLAGHYASNPNVMFGLMNEPHVQTATEWLASVNAAIAAIRDAGATQEILVPGAYWDGAWNWTTTDNAKVIGTGVVDPDHNFAFEVHQYLDANSSGKSPNVVSETIGVERLAAITQWAETNHVHLFLGEIGVSTGQTSLTALDLTLSYMNQHTDVWQGVTYWAGGPWWGSYMYSIEPQNGHDKPQMAILQSFEATVTIQSEVLSNGRVTLTGTTTGESNGSIAVYDGKTLLGDTTTDSTGAWKFTTQTATDTVHVYSVTTTNAAVNIPVNSLNVAILGSSKADSLVGTNGNDIIIGNGGSDKITGGLGADVLTGGSGHVTFIYNSVGDSISANPDTITDFNYTRDVIDLTNIAGINTQNGRPIFQGKLAGSGHLTLNAHSIGYLEVGGNTDVLVNTSNSNETVTTSNISAANMEIVLVGINLHLSSGNFHHV